MAWYSGSWRCGGEGPEEGRRWGAQLAGLLCPPWSPCGHPGLGRAAPAAYDPQQLHVAVTAPASAVSS